MHLVWVDLEMTGLEVFGKDQIMELAIILTDSELNEVEGGRYHAILHQPKEVLEGMNEWCTQHHGQSGLTKQCLSSTKTYSEVEEEVLKFFKDHQVRQKECYLAGNSVHMDKMFLMRYMPLIPDYLHYRIVDTSSVKVLGQMWFPHLEGPRKAGSHRAMDDITESIEELRHYRAQIFK